MWKFSHRACIDVLPKEDGRKSLWTNLIATPSICPAWAVLLHLTQQMLNYKLWGKTKYMQGLHDTIWITIFSFWWCMLLFSFLGYQEHIIILIVWGLVRCCEPDILHYLGLGMKPWPMVVYPLLAFLWIPKDQLLISTALKCTTVSGTEKEKLWKRISSRWSVVC